MAHARRFTGMSREAARARMGAPQSHAPNVLIFACAQPAVRPPPTRCGQRIAPLRPWHAHALRTPPGDQNRGCHAPGRRHAARAAGGGAQRPGQGGRRNLTCARRSRCRCEGAHGPGCRDARACVYHRRRVVLREAVGCTQRARRGSARCSNRRRLAGRPCSLPRAVPADPGARAANSARRALCACINCVIGGRFHAETRGVALPGGPRPP